MGLPQWKGGGVTANYAPGHGRPRHRQQLQHVAELPAISEIARIEAADALAMKLRWGAGDAEREPEQDAELVARVHRVDVVAGISLRVPGLLRLRKRILQAFAGRHPREYVVAGAVDDRSQLE